VWCKGVKAEKSGLVVRGRVGRGNTILAFYLVDEIRSICICLFVEDDNNARVILLYLCSPPRILGIRLPIEH
jgi:hypothetical protein